MRITGIALLVLAGCASSPTSSSEEPLTCDIGGTASLGNACIKASTPGSTQTAQPLSTTNQNLTGVNANVYAWGIRLSSVNGHYEGVVGFDPPDNGTYEIYLSSNPPFRVVDEISGPVDAPTCSSAISSSECPSLRHVGTYTLAKGRPVRLEFGPTTVSYVRLHIQTRIPTPDVCAADELTEETAACNATSATETPLTANTLTTTGFTSRVAITPGTVYGVKLPAVSGGYGGWIYMDVPDTVELYLGTPNIPLRVFNYDDFNDTHMPITECSRYIPPAECSKLRRGTRFVGGRYRIEFGPSASSYVRVELRQAAGGGTIAFGAPATYDAGQNGYFLTAGDLNADSQPDLVEASAGDVHILRGTSTGAFSDVASFSTDAPGETVVSDFNRDGNGDIAGIAWDGMGALPAYYLQGQGNFAFAQSTWGDGRDFNGTLRSGDFDEDGTLDLVAPYFGGFVILKMPGFVVLQDVPEDSQDTVKAVAGDFDGDGHQDLMVAGGQSNVVSFFRGNGSGTVTLAGQTTLPGGTILRLSAFDLDRDGRSDVIAIHEANISGNTVTVSYGTSSGLGSAQIIAPVPGNATGIAAADFDGDGRLDLAIGNTGNNFDAFRGTVDVWRNTTAGMRHVLTLNVNDGVGWALATGDFNGDGFADLAVPGLNAVTIYLATP